MALVSVQQAMDALRYDGMDNLPIVQMAVDAASAAVLSHLKFSSDAYADSSGVIPTDSNGDPLDIPKDIQQAVIYLTGYFLRDPSGVEGKDWDQWSLPRPVIALLYSHRKPSYA